MLTELKISRARLHHRLTTERIHGVKLPPQSVRLNKNK